MILLFYLLGVVAAYNHQRWLFRKMEDYNWNTVVFNLKSALLSWLHFAFLIVGYIVLDNKNEPPKFL